MEICFNNLFGDGIGWNFGVSNWIKYTKKFLQKSGATYLKEATVALSIGLPRSFMPVASKFNVFMTLFETEDLFDDDYEKLNKADLIIVPCEQNKVVLKRNLNATVPVVVVTGGVDPHSFTYKKRKFNGSSPLYLLYVGAMNPRKGYQTVIDTFSKITNPFVKLYIKTTQEGKYDIEYSEDKRIVYDYRILSSKELNKLYHSCHIFLLPSHGEGIGLTALEAAATGMIVINTPFGGTTEFLNSSNSFPIKYELDTTILEYPVNPPEKRSTKWAFPDIDDFERLINYSIENYNKTINLFSKELKKIRKDFSWEVYTDKLYAVIEAYEETYNKLTKKKILNLGCGNRQFAGTYGVDNRKEVNPDIVYDLSKVPFTFSKDEEYDEILCLNILEHFIEIIPLMKEFYRILKKDGILHVQVPYYKSVNFFIDPTHYHAFHENTMDFFDKSTFHGSINNYANVNFKILNRELLQTEDLYFVLQKKCIDCVGCEKCAP